MPIKITAAIVIGLALAAIAGAGAWLASRHYQPTIDNLNGLLTTCKSRSQQQAAAIDSQNAGITALQTLEALHKAVVAEAQKQAAEEAKGDYAKANSVMAERSEGDLCAAASSAFDAELKRERSQ